MQPYGKKMNYREFLQWNEELAEKQQTSGENQSEDLIQYTALNYKRMQRIDKNTQLNDAFKNAIDKIDEKQQWILITEAWCGDSAQNVPVIGMAAEYAKDKIDLTTIMRDENTHLVEKFAPEQSMAIPRLLAFDQYENLLFQWGARPEPAQKIMDKWKADPANKSKDDVQKEIQLWYAKDKYQTIQNELAELIKKTVKQTSNY